MAEPRAFAAVVFFSFALNCAVPNANGQRGFRLGTTSHKAAPTAWQGVHLVEVSLAPGDISGFAVPPHEALGRAITQRLGARVEGAGSLLVTQVRVSHWTDGKALHMGLSADFALRNKGDEKALRLEQSVSIMNPLSEGSDAGYARLIDDVCDHLFYHPQALAFLGQQEVSSPEDSALAAGAREVGPVLPTPASGPSVEAKGRVLWGKHEQANSGAVMLMLGDTKLVTMSYANRSANTRSGFGQRSAFGVAVMPGTQSSTTVAGQTINTSQPTYFGLNLQAGLEFGHRGVLRSADGYLLAPGFSVLAVPQAQVFWLIANQNKQNVTLTMATVGGAVELEVPLGSTLGLKAALFVGATAASVSTGDFKYTTGFQRVVNPSFDFYTQTSTGRASLGVGLQTLANAAGGQGASAVTKNPMLVFTWEDWIGRGVAYSKHDLEVLGRSLQASEEVLSMPRNAFLDASGQPLSPPAPKVMAPYRPGDSSQSEEPGDASQALGQQ